MISYRLSRRDIVLLACLMVTGGVVAILESLGVAVFFPLLQGAQGLGAVKVPFPFDRFYGFFADLPLVQRIRTIAVMLVAIHLTRISLLHLNIHLSLVIRGRIVKFYKMACVRQLMQVGMGYFNTKRASDLQLLFETHIGYSIGAVVELLCDLVPSVLTALVLMALLLVFSWQITLVAVVLVGMSSFVLSVLSSRVRAAGKGHIDAQAASNKVFFDIINGMKVLRLFGAEEHCTNTFGAQADLVNHAYERMSRLTRSVGPFFEAIGITILAVILFFGSWIIPMRQGDAAMTFLLTFLIIIARLIPPMKQFNYARGIIITRLPVLKEVEEFLHQQDKKRLPNGTVVFQGLREKIEFCGVDFGYDTRPALVLRQMSFAVLKGTKVGIVGSSGAGKSTIAELLLRFYDPAQGGITVDGRDLRDMDLRSWRSHIGVVSQDTFLFHETIRSNIAFADPGASMEEIQRAARRAHAHDFIMQMPHGYDTLIGDRGVLLSGGQRQRLAIARAILKEPDILIFDEATSALDTTSEKTVQEALDEISKGKTVITIAHRLSTVADSHNILVLHEGRVVEQGTHQQLLRHNGLYRKFAGNQHLQELSA